MRTRLLRVAGLLLLACLYEALAWYAGWPGPAGIFHALRAEVQNGVLQHDIAVSCARWMLGWIPGAFAGVLLGLITGRNKTVRSLLEPSRLLLRAIPFIGLVPIVTSIFGTSETGKRTLIWWMSCSICWPLVDAAAAAVPVTILWRAATLGAGRWDRMKLVGAHCEGAVYSALRASLSLAWILVVLVEMVGVYQRSSGLFWSEGLGYRLFRSQEEGQDGLLIGVLVIFACIGGLAEGLLKISWVSLQSLSVARRKKSATQATNQLSQQSTSPNREWGTAGRLVVSDLRADYTGKEVFSHCSFALAAGETLAILGKSGSGKTTLLRALAGLHGTDLQICGTVLLDEMPVTIDQRIGIVFQDALVFPHMTVWENVLFGKRARTNPQYAYDLLVGFGMGDLVAQVSETLSGGQRQRLALASALANAPQVLLLDEPFGALDAITRTLLQKQFIQKIRGQISCIFVTHDIAEAMEIASKSVMVGIGTDSTIIELPSMAESSRASASPQSFADTYEKLFELLRNDADLPPLLHVSS